MIVTLTWLLIHAYFRLCWSKVFYRWKMSYEYKYIYIYSFLWDIQLSTLQKWSATYFFLFLWRYMPPHGPILNWENGFVDLREKSQSQWDWMLDALEHEVNGALVVAWQIKKYIIDQWSWWIAVDKPFLSICQVVMVIIG